MRKLVVAIVGVVFVVGMATGAGANDAASARVSPHGRLRDGRDVLVRWTGFLGPEHGHTTQFLQVAECSRDFTVETATFANYVQYCDEYDAQISTRRGFWDGEVHVSRVGHAGVQCAADACEMAVIAGHDTPDHNPVIERAAVALITLR